MKARALTRTATAAAIAVGALAGTASAAGAHGSVFVQTDNLAGNQVVSYARAADGTLAQKAAYDTGGLGGQLTGSVVDHLASQGSLAIDGEAGLLFAVNAGSNTVSVFGVDGGALSLHQTVDSGGTFPASVATRGGLAYVLNGLDGGSVQGFRVAGGRLVKIPGSNRPLGLNPLATPQFVNTPGQVAFSRDGSQLIVTTKANGSSIDVFGVLPSGRLSAAPTVNSLPGTVPFALVLDPSGNLVVAEAGTNAVATFSLGTDGTVTQLASVATGQAATCWIVRAGGNYYASNAGSGSLSGISESPDGDALTLLGQNATDAGTVDAAATDDGRYLYAQTGKDGNVDEYAVQADGSLSRIGTVTVPGAAGGEGIVAS